MVTKYQMNILLPDRISFFMKIILTCLLVLAFGSSYSQNETLKISTVDSAIYFRPEIEAEFPGGILSWQRFVKKEMASPVRADITTEGTVEVQFIVDKKGNSHKVKAISGPEELHSAAVDIIKGVDLWMPAVNNGRKVDSWKTQPVIFKSNN
jgi:periplasmic protein TonB